MSWACCARRLSSGWGDERRWRERVAGVVLSWMAVMNVAAVVNADEPSPVIRVEEDWELVLRTPDVAANAPQVTCVISPVDHLHGGYASIELNHQTQPDFAPGGVHLQAWDADYCLETQDSSQDEVLSQGGETVLWTQSMHLTDCGLKFAVAGAGPTWGAFGGDGELRATLSSPLSSLNDYRPSTSVAHSGVGFASNRVTRLVLKEVRYYSASGLLSRDGTQRVVYPK